MRKMIFISLVIPFISSLALASPQMSLPDGSEYLSGPSNTIGSEFPRGPEVTMRCISNVLYYTGYRSLAQSYNVHTGTPYFCVSSRQGNKNKVKVYYNTSDIGR